MTRVRVIVLKWEIQKTDFLRYQILRKKLELRLRMRIPDVASRIYRCTFVVSGVVFCLVERVEEKEALFESR